MRIGSTWRIGNGEKVLIRGDNWLLEQFSKQVIDEETPCWLEERVCEELMPHEANAVLSIPLSSRQPEDTLIW